VAILVTTPPPPPSYAPTAGRTTWWTQTAATVWTPENLAAADAMQQRLTEAVEQLSRSITETPDERRQRLQAEDDVVRAAAGETPKQRVRRHAAERRKAERAATRAWKASPDDKARRFRWWCILTAASASAGYSMGLVQWVSAALPALVTGVFVLPAAYWLDLRMRGGWNNAVRLSDLHGWRNSRRILGVILARIPLSSALASLLHLDALLAYTGHIFH
jgi:hypothetical protein